MEAYKTLKARRESGEASWLTKDSGRWMSSVPGGKNSGIGPTGASYVPISEGRIGTRSGWRNGTRLMPGRYAESRHLIVHLKGKRTATLGRTKWRFRTPGLVRVGHSVVVYDRPHCSIDREFTATSPKLFRPGGWG